MAASSVVEPTDVQQRSRRHKRWLGFGVFSLVAVLLSAWWFLWVPNWRPPLEAGERYGIDVSAHQDSIDWKEVAGDNIRFAYIKATEGGDFIDERFDQNWRGAGTAGLDRGAYHFFTLCTPGPDQARNFLNVAPPEREALPPAVDLELAGNCSARPSQVEVSGQIDDFLKPVEAAWGRKLVLYVGDDFERAYPVSQRRDHPLWVRRFLLRPNPKGWTIWQLQGYALVSGIAGGVDLDVMRASP